MRPLGTRPVIIVPYDPAWPGRFAQLGGQLRAALGDVALRIDHVGSTAVPGLASKPVIDLQISVRSFEPSHAFVAPLTELGFVYRVDNPDRVKRYFREPPGEAETHIHVRRAGSFAEQTVLLFRDYLRSHPEDAADYTELKQRLAERYANDRLTYSLEKSGLIWELIARADRWAQATGWEPGPSDA